MGNSVAKSWGINCTSPFIDEPTGEVEIDNESCCAYLMGHRNTRDVEAVAVEEKASSSSEPKDRSQVKRDVNLSFPAPREEPVSPEAEGGEASPASHGLAEVPSSIRRLAEAAQARSGVPKDAPLEIAGLPLPDFWGKLVNAESQGKETDEEKLRVRAEKLLSFRHRYAWPLTISVKNVERALRSEANVYLPPRGPGDKPLVIFTTAKLDTQLCSMEEYQMLTMFMLEAAFRDTAVDKGNGAVLVFDVRRLSSVVGQALLAGFTDMARFLAMLTGALPVKVAHVQLIEDENGARVTRTLISLAVGRLSSKIRSRIHRGSPDDAVNALGQDILPVFLGGRRDTTEYSQWLEQLHLDPSIR